MALIDATFREFQLKYPLTAVEPLLWTRAMKEFAISVFVILVLSCIFNSVAMWMGILPEMPPYPYGSTITDVKSSAPSFGCKRDDFCYPEMNLTNGKRATNYITDITETGDRSSAEFPFGANN